MLLASFSFLFFNFCFSFYSPTVTQPLQPTAGPGGMEYLHESVIFQDFATDPDGYWLFEPAEPKPDSAHVVVFVHGYGGYNPMIYGKWIRHLVRKGNIVIYPRYQRDMLFPHPSKFSENVSQAIRDALEELEKEGHVKPIVSNLALVGHSYGGVVCADLAVNFEKHKIPKPTVAMLCAPGTGKFTGGRLKSYEDMHEDLRLLIVVNDNDWVVGDEFAVKVFNEAIRVRNRNLLRQFADPHGNPTIQATHNQCYSLDTLYDSGVRNFTANRALQISTVDAVDFFGYWKLLDAMLECDRNGQFCEVAFGGSEAQVSLGSWSDGVAVRALAATLPD